MAQTGRKMWLGLSGLGLVLAVAGTLWIYREAKRAAEDTEPDRAISQGQAIPVRTALVSQVVVDQVIGATAATAASDTFSVQLGLSRGVGGNSPSDLIVKALYVHEGDYVTKGQILFEVEDANFREIVKQYEASFAAAKATLARVKQQITYNDNIRDLEMNSANADHQYRTKDLRARELEFEAFTKLYHQEKAASLFSYFDAMSLYAQAKFALSEAERRITRAKAALKVGSLQDAEDLANATRDYELTRVNLEIALRDLNRLKVRSQLDGFVDFTPRQELVAGQVIQTSFSYFTVLQVDPLRLIVDFPQERLDELAIGQRVEVVLDSYPKETFEGVVHRVSPQVKSDLRVLPVFVRLSNPDRRIKSGVNGYARIHSTKKATVVPATAVIQHGPKAMVFGVENGRARMREIRTRHVLEPGMIEVSSGLDAGDEVVIFSNFYRDAGMLTVRDCYLKDNDPVNPEWRKWAGRE